MLKTILTTVLGMSATLITLLNPKVKWEKEMVEALQASFAFGQAALNGNVTKEQAQKVRKEFNEAIDACIAAL